MKEKSSSYICIMPQKETFKDLLSVSYLTCLWSIPLIILFHFTLTRTSPSLNPSMPPFNNFFGNHESFIRWTRPSIICQLYTMRISSCLVSCRLLRDFFFNFFNYLARRKVVYSEKTHSEIFTFKVG